ncbi:12762_t:CDS:2 [Acaulospora morrowiae]|uniref:12762_t:CDS:1 n=1 Tax=Acaulospora morrowiae TaxID=94023 RepID=A0A9N9BYJ5_9GLOM|nr:12762_t:CDS:2 [Acaulospora morrowiae]
MEEETNKSEDTCQSEDEELEDLLKEEEEIEMEEESEQAEDEESEEEEEEQSDYEENVQTRTRGKATPKTPPEQKQSKQMQNEEPQVESGSRKRTRFLLIFVITAESLSVSENRVLTKRQRAKLDDSYEQDLLQLPMEPMRKKQLTEEEIQLKKSEIARRRKHQSIQRAEEDKMNIINRLLRKQTSKKRTKDQDDNDSVHNDNGSGSNTPSVFHYVTNQKGCSLSVPRGVKIPIEFSKGPTYPPPIPMCSFSGCQLPKKYRSTKTLEFACSMEHLKKIDAQI